MDLGIWEDLVQKRFGNSSAAKGLKALLSEARAEVRMHIHMT